MSPCKIKNRIPSLVIPVRNLPIINICFLVCSTYLPNLSPDDFHSHVDSHFDEDESDFFELMNRAD